MGKVARCCGFKCGPAVLGSALLALVVAGSPAQAWEPSETVRIVVHTPAGSGADLFARAVADIIEREGFLPVPVEVLNRPGGGGMVAMSFTAEQAGNPHYIMSVTNAYLATPLRQKSDLNYEDFEMIAILAEDSNAIQVSADSPYQILGDLIAAAKAEPKSISLGFGSIGGTDHMIGFKLGQAVGAEFNNVAFEGGGTAATALLGGHIDFVTGGPSETIGQIRAGRIRPLAVIGDQRLDSMPDVPTLKELGIDLGATFAVIRGFVAPPDTPDQAIDYYASLFLDKVAATPQWAEFVAKSDFVRTELGPVEMEEYVAQRSSDIAETLTAMGIME